MAIGQYLKAAARIISLSVYLIFGFSVVSTYGQDLIHNFRHVSTSDGFSLNSVNSIDQDDKGMIWLGTRNLTEQYLLPLYRRIIDESQKVNAKKPFCSSLYS